MGYVATNFEQEMIISWETSDIEKSYELPDGGPITIGNERFCCWEPLFMPQLLRKEELGIHELVNQPILKCNVNIRQELLNNIVIIR